MEKHSKPNAPNSCVLPGIPAGFQFGAASRGKFRFAFFAGRRIIRTKTASDSNTGNFVEPTIQRPSKLRIVLT